MDNVVATAAALDKLTASQLGMTCVVQGSHNLNILEMVATATFDREVSDEGHCWR
jgi:hypothetical protein